MTDHVLGCAAQAISQSPQWIQMTQAIGEAGFQWRRTDAGQPVRTDQDSPALAVGASS
jgi:hypothetical protein